MDEKSSRIFNFGDNTTYIESQTIYVSGDFHQSAPDIEHSTTTPAPQPPPEAAIPLHQRKATATEAMAKVLEGCRTSLARGYDYNKVDLAFRQMLGQTPQPQSLQYARMSDELWNSFLLTRKRCTPEAEGGYIRATLLNIVGYWKGKGLFGSRSNREVACLLYDRPTQADIDNVKNGITANEALSALEPLLRHCLDEMR